MEIGIIGAGLMGSALGGAWARAGHAIRMSYARTPQRVAQVAAEIGGQARAGTPAEAAQADVVLLAVRWANLDDALAQAGSLRGKIVLTCMLPMTADDEHLAVGFTTSGAELLAERSGARVIGSFNTVWSDVIRNPQRSTPASMFYVSGAGEQATAEELIRDAGFRPVHVGGLEQARLLEPFGLLMGRMGFAVDPLVYYQFMAPGAAS
jgi:8-hydroxy-5-deazaflavin:NADPH oxidoreductase